MRFDEYGLILSGADSSPADMGDSAAESSRYVHLKQQINETPPIVLSFFRTETGYVRHPSPLLPADWRESDFSSDQALPLFLAMRNTRYQLGSDEMYRRIKEAGWRTGNGNLVSPMFYSLLTNSKTLLNLTIIAQALIFKIPFRWSDSKRKFETSEDASGDYLNFFHASLYASKWARWFVSKATLVAKIEHYYRNEPNSADLVNLYKQVIDLKY